ALLSYVVSQDPLYDPLIHSTSRVKPKNSMACSHCKKSKAKCSYLGNNPCKRCVERGLECTFYPQKRRGPKPGKKTKSDTSNLAVFQKLNQDYTRKAHKLGFDIHRIVASPNNSDVAIPNYNTILPIEENLIMALNSSSTWEDNNNQCFFTNNGTEAETDPMSTLPYPNHIQLISHSFPFTYSAPFQRSRNNTDDMYFISSSSKVAQISGTNHQRRKSKNQ
ncbi:7947_t:CDS:2, partial [Dentiscutata erythropus]